MCLCDWSFHDLGWSNEDSRSTIMLALYEVCCVTTPLKDTSMAWNKSQKGHTKNFSHIVEVYKADTPTSQAWVSDCSAP